MPDASRVNDPMRILSRPADDAMALKRYLAATLRQVAERKPAIRGLRATACAGSLSAGAEAARLKRIEAAPVPFAFAAWIEHLFFLDALLETRLVLRADELFPEERRGLELLRQAREEFWQRHELCPGCGALLIRGGTCMPCSLLYAARSSPRIGLAPMPATP